MPDADTMAWPPSQAETRQSCEAEPSASAKTAWSPDSVSGAARGDPVGVCGAVALERQRARARRQGAARGGSRDGHPPVEGRRDAVCAVLDDLFLCCVLVICCQDVLSAPFADRFLADARSCG